MIKILEKLLCKSSAFSKAAGCWQIVKDFDNSCRTAFAEYLSVPVFMWIKSRLHKRNSREKFPKLIQNKSCETITENMQTEPFDWISFPKYIEIIGSPFHKHLSPALQKKVEWKIKSALYMHYIELHALHWNSCALYINQ